jgi:hypothetical protein
MAERYAVLPNSAYLPKLEGSVRYAEASSPPILPYACINWLVSAVAAVRSRQKRRCDVDDESPRALTMVRGMGSAHDVLPGGALMDRERNSPTARSHARSSA